MTGKLGNPAPLGLFAFGMTTAMLMYVDMGWVEHEFEQTVCGAPTTLLSRSFACLSDGADDL